MQKLQGKAARFQREQPVVKLTFVLQRNEVENNQNEQWENEINDKTDRIIVS